MTSAPHLLIIFVVLLQLLIADSFKISLKSKLLQEPENENEETENEEAQVPGEQETAGGEPVDITLKGMQSLLEDTQATLSPMIAELFSDEKGAYIRTPQLRQVGSFFRLSVLECLAPFICNLISPSHFYNPYLSRCQKMSIFKRLLLKPKPVRPREHHVVGRIRVLCLRKIYPELTESCQQPDITFADYATTKHLTQH